MAIAQKITELTALAAPAAGDMLPIVDDPSGGPATRNTLLSDLLKDIVVTDAEDAAGVTPTDLRFPEGWFERMGAVGDGIANDTTAIKNTILAARQSRIISNEGSATIIRGNGRYLFDAQLDFTSVSVDMPTGIFVLASAFSASPAIIGHLGSGNSTASRKFVISVDGKLSDQTNSNLVNVEFEDYNWVNTVNRIALINCKGTGLRVTGNTETQTFHVRGADNTELLISEGITGNTPDENVYIITANTVDQLFVQENTSQSTSCRLIFNCEAIGANASDYPVIIKANKEIFLDGIIRGFKFGAIHIDAGASLHVHANMNLFGQTGEVTPALKVTACGVLNGTFMATTTIGGVFRLLVVNHGGRCDFISRGSSGGHVLELGATFAVEEMDIYLSAEENNDPIGKHDGLANASVLTDTTKSFTVNEFVGQSIFNVTDGSSGTITANTATTITATLVGGTDDDWDINDAYVISFDVFAVNLKETKVFAALSKNGAYIKTCPGSSFDFPTTYMSADTPIMIADVNFPISQSAGVTLRGPHTDAVLQAYSFPFKTMRSISRDNQGRPAYFTGVGATGGWQMPTVEDL